MGNILLADYVKWLIGNMSISLMPWQRTTWNVSNRSDNVYTIPWKNIDFYLINVAQT